MTVKELIEALLNKKQDAEVLLQSTGGIIESVHLVEDASLDDTERFGGSYSRIGDVVVIY